jgi:hypothetical protein
MLSYIQQELKINIRSTFLMILFYFSSLAVVQSSGDIKAPTPRDMLITESQLRRIPKNVLAGGDSELMSSIGTRHKFS